MPTIDDLQAATASADTDELLVSQNGDARKVTRSLFLAGLQQQLALPQGSLLGRASAGTGTPETLVVGANLVLAEGTLSAAAAPYSVAGLPSGTTPGLTDRVALAQSGADAAIPYAQFMAGLGAVPGVNGSHLLATATAASAARSLADWLADAVTVEGFGAAGDGVTDDSAALAAAVASGRPVRFGPKTYVVNGQWTIAQPAVLIGAPGLTVLKRASQSSGGAWISIQGPSFAATGIVFDADRAAIAQESWGVLVTNACTTSQFEKCVFANAQGPTLGCGITFLASDPAASSHVVRDCEMSGNDAHGLWVQAVAGVQVINCRAHDNGGYGLCLDYTDITFTAKVRLAQVLGNACWGNQRGISLGNYNATNTQPPVWGNANPDAIAAIVADNSCHDNVVYGIAVSGQALAVQNNLLSNNGSAGNGGAGLLANVSASRIAANMITGAGQYGIDSGGSIDTDIVQNYVTGSVIGINAGGSQRVRVAGNLVQGCVWAVTIYNVETDGQGNNFGLAAQSIDITDNWITIPGAGGGGVYLIDAPQGVQVARNSFVGESNSNISQALWAHTDGLIVADNRWNNTQRFICNPATVGGVQLVLVPDIADSIMITAAPSGVQSMLTQHQNSVQGQIGFVKVTAGGSGYTHATVAIAGAGSGAQATAYVSGGAVIGVALTNPGSGYGGLGATATVTITGDGSGATATASVGLPVPEERRLRISCNCAVHFTRVGSNPFQDNWTLYDITIPANAAVEFAGTWGAWRAVQFPGFDYLAPPGDGSLAVRTVNGGDLVLHPSGGGHVRITSDAESAGIISCIGRGSPLGVVTAPPGSDYRNLNGGAGSTLWIKLSGQDASGWVAIA
ncbi:MAG TPA: right-handed parallel beta-helix repeat-containing protein [Acetobacteraceae bacterium]|nr:right-handed parallel beta-helix repeat-containing protein [Acetobacteraceae bacterium]